MNKIFKTTGLVLVTVLLLFALVSCTSSLSLTFTVETGDSIEVTLDSSTGYLMKANGATFEIYKGDTLTTKGIFLNGDMMEPYLSIDENTPDVTLYEKTDDKVFYQSGNEWNYVFKVADSSTGIALVNLISKESAEECYSLLTITNEK